MNKNIITRVSTQAISLLLLTLVPVSIPVWAHGGEEHSDRQTTAQITQGNFSISGFGEVYELTVVYEAFETDENVALRLFVANLETNRPVSDADLKLTLTGPELDLELTPTLVEASPGEYGIEVSIPEDSDYSFLVEVSTLDEFDLFSIDGFRPPPTQEVAEGDESSSSLGDYQAFLVLAGFIIVGIGAYSLGTRDRKMRQNHNNEEQQDTGEVT